VRPGFKEHPQKGNAYNFSKEASTVYTLTMGWRSLRWVLAHQRGVARAGGTPILVDFEDPWARTPSTA
jgi:hypothetical protein